MWREKDITREYLHGDVIIEQGDSGKEMFIIKSGSVDVIKRDGEKEILLATLERGDFFGEMALLENVPRTATVRARETTSVIVLNMGSFFIKIKKDPTFAFNIMQRMSTRIRMLDEKILKQADIREPDRSKIDFAIAKSEYVGDKDL